MVRWSVLLSLLAMLLSCGGGASSPPPHPPAPPASTPRATSTPLRGIQVVLRHVPIERARWLVREARKHGFTHLIPQVTDGVQLETAPWTPLPTAWTKVEFVRWLAYARQKGLEVIPELKLLTHQKKFFGANAPELLWNRETYDPRNPEAYRQVFALLDEVLATVQPRAVHIGHDEVFGHREPDNGMLPATLFLADVQRLHAWLTQRGVAVWMWGDMLLSPAEFPTMNPQHLHGGAPGYGRDLRQQLPRDLTIGDWHYSDKQPEFPSLPTFQAEGFRVLGMVGQNPRTQRAFTHYAAQHGAAGMLVHLPVEWLTWTLETTTFLRDVGALFRHVFPDP